MFDDLFKGLEISIPLIDVFHERIRQEKKWGTQRHPDGTHPVFAEFANIIKEENDDAIKNNNITWSDILTEEVSEAQGETDPEKLRTELIQVAAVCTAWVEDIDRRKQYAGF
jgi:hypothetical protein